MKQCPVCVKEIADDASFCPYCGCDATTGVAPIRAKQDGHRGYTGGLTLIVLGVIFLISTYTSYGFGDLWPLILIAVGIGTMLKR